MTIRRLRAVMTNVVLELAGLALVHASIRLRVVMVLGIVALAIAAPENVVLVIAVLVPVVLVIVRRAALVVRAVPASADRILVVPTVVRVVPAVQG